MVDMTNIPDPGFRMITIIVRPGKDVEVNWTGFAHYEAEAALRRAYDLIEQDAEDQFVLGTENIEEDPHDGS